MGSTKNSAFDGWSAGLRLLIALFSIASLILLIKSEQTVQRPIGGIDYVVSQVKYSDTSGFIFLVFINILVAAYCVLAVLGLSVPLALGSGGHAGKAGRWVLFLVEQVLVYVQLSAASAGTEIAYLAQGGLQKSSWEAVCPVYGVFCRMVRVSIVFSFMSVVLLAILSILSARALFCQYYRRPLFASTKSHHSANI